MKTRWLIVLLGLALTPILPAQTTVEVTLILTHDAQLPPPGPEQLLAHVADTPAHIVSVRSLKGLHLQFVLLNDQSGSNKWPGGTAQQAFLEDAFLQALMVPGVDRGSLLNYNDEFYFDAKETSDPAVISSKIVRAGRGGTATHDAIVRATRWLKKQPLAPESRKAIFLFTDGDLDNASTSSFKSALDDISKTGIPVFVMVPQSSKIFPEMSHLKDIASKSGGEIYLLGPQDNGHQAFAILRSELDNSFSVTLEVPADAKKGLQKLSIKSQMRALSIHSPEKIWIEK